MLACDCLSSLPITALLLLLVTSMGCNGIVAVDVDTVATSVTLPLGLLPVPQLKPFRERTSSNTVTPVASCCRTGNP